MYTTELEVLQAIKSAFKETETLNREAQNSKCKYAPTYNNVGCAVGCLINEDDAKIWDCLSDASVTHIYETEHDLFSEYFTDEMLYILQNAQDKHDQCDGYGEFMLWLDAAIAERS